MMKKSRFQSAAVLLLTVALIFSLFGGVAVPIGGGGEIPLGPDLVVSSISLPPSIGVNLPFTVTVAVDNTGDQAAGDFKVELFVDPPDPPSRGYVGGVMQEQTINGLDALASANATFTVSLSTPGDHTIYAVADYANDVDELGVGAFGETNNTGGPQTVNVINNKPVAYITTVAPNPAVEGQSVGFSGYGTDADPLHTITGYRWHSSIDEQLSGAASFSTSNLSVGTHTISFSVRDPLGAWSETSATRTLIVEPDVTPPDDPGIDGATPVKNVWTTDNTVLINFSGADDDATGVDGFSYDWYPSDTHLPDSVIDAQETAASATSPALGDGNWWFHLRTRDNAANWTSTVHYGPFKIDRTPPSAAISAPAYSTNVSKTTTFKVGWSGSDAASGIAAYDIQYKIGVGGAWTNWKAGTTAASADFKGKAGKTYYFRAQAKDAAGNVGAWSAESKTIVPFDNNSLISSRTGFGATFSKAASSFYRGTVRYSTTKGDFITYKFTGKSVAFIATKGKNRSKAKIYIDGKYKKTVNTYAASIKYRQAVYIKNFTKVRTHTITIENVDDRRRLDVDALGVGQ